MNTRRTGRLEPAIAKAGPESGIGKRIRDAREAQGMKASELARVAQIHRATLKHYEAGDRLPGTKELRRLCEALGKSPNELVFGGDTSLEFVSETDATTWAKRLPDIIRAATGFIRMPANDQLAVTQLINSLAAPYYSREEKDNIEEGISMLIPMLDAIASRDMEAAKRESEILMAKFSRQSTPRSSGGESD